MRSNTGGAPVLVTGTYMIYRKIVRSVYLLLITDVQVRGLAQRNNFFFNALSYHTTGWHIYDTITTYWQANSKIMIGK